MGNASGFRSARTSTLHQPPFSKVRVLAPSPDSCKSIRQTAHDPRSLPRVITRRSQWLREFACGDSRWRFKCLSHSREASAKDGQYMSVSGAIQKSASGDTSSIIRAAQDGSRVAGFTHDFYRYPARFSPVFVRSVLEHYTQPGDWVVDPFAGGGTTLVEALALGRNALGTRMR